jgi:hypothetical protein
MQESGVAVNDLYSLVVEQRAQLARGDRFRWKAPAYELMGKQIAETITNPFSPASGPPMSFLNGLHPKSKLLGASQSPERRGWRS